MIELLSVHYIDEFSSDMDEEMLIVLELFILSRFSPLCARLEKFVNESVR